MRWLLLCLLGCVENPIPAPQENDHYLEPIPYQGCFLVNYYGELAINIYEWDCDGKIEWTASCVDPDAGYACGLLPDDAGSD
jgi:hypothetical protein